jgi:hypothetical protein
MKNFSLALMAIVPIVTTVNASGDEPLPPLPTGLESFVEKPTVVLELAEEVGTLRSTDATVAVAAVIATDRARPGEQMKGARFSLENNGGADLIYLGEAEIQALLKDLADIERGIPNLKADRDAPWRVQGTASCWMPAEPRRILCPNYHVGPEGSGFGLAPYGSSGYSFPDQRPADFAALLERAMTRLQGR